MNDKKLIERFEPVKSILEWYIRFGDRKTLLTYLFRFLVENLGIESPAQRIELFYYLVPREASYEEIEPLILDIIQKSDFRENINLLIHLVHRIKINSEKEERPEQNRQVREFNRLFVQFINLHIAFEEIPSKFRSLFRDWLMCIR